MDYLDIAKVWILSIFTGVLNYLDEINTIVLIMVGLVSIIYTIYKIRNEKQKYDHAEEDRKNKEKINGK